MAVDWEEVRGLRLEVEGKIPQAVTKTPCHYGVLSLVVIESLCRYVSGSPGDILSLTGDNYDGDLMMDVSTSDLMTRSK